VLAAAVVLAAADSKGPVDALNNVLTIASSALAQKIQGHSYPSRVSAIVTVERAHGLSSEQIAELCRLIRAEYPEG
jgi:hypothetical protein